MSNTLFSDTVTLYNHYRINRSDAWQRTVIRGVQVREKAEKSLDATGLHLASLVSVTIPVDADADGRHYLPPALFAASDHREQYWSLDVSGSLDVLVIGECGADLNSLYTLDQLQKEHCYVTIKAITDNTIRPLLKHWRVTCT